MPSEKLADIRLLETVSPPERLDSSKSSTVSQPRHAHSHHSHRAHSHHDDPDASQYMRGLPKSIPRFFTWFGVAVFAGAVIALGIIFLSSFRQ
jgi:hypothetical protein